MHDCHSLVVSLFLGVVPAAPSSPVIIVVKVVRVVIAIALVVGCETSFMFVVTMVIKAHKTTLQACIGQLCAVSTALV
jgi:hypothetical protein